MEPLALTIAQAAQLGGPCRSAIYQDIRAGRLRAIKRGRSTRILMDDFKAYLASFPAFHDKADGLSPARVKQADGRKGSQTLFDFAQSEDRGPSLRRGSRAAMAVTLLALCRPPRLSPDLDPLGLANPIIARRPGNAQAFSGG